MVFPGGRLMVPAVSTNAVLEDRRVTSLLSRIPAGLFAVIRNKDLDAGISFPSVMLPPAFAALCT
ncbi:hypothetical protein D3C87_1292370 [compost metagenome]